MKLTIALLATTLALSACGGSTDNSSSTDSADVAASDISAESNMSSEGSTNAGYLARVVAEPKPFVSHGFSDNDTLKIRHYGTCASLLKNLIYGLNRRGVALPKEVEIARSTYAQRYAIYQLMMINIVLSYPKDLHQNGLEISEEYAKNNAGISFTYSQIMQSYQENCPISDYVPDVANSIIENQNDIFQQLYDEAERSGL